MAIRTTSVCTDCGEIDVNPEIHDCEPNETLGSCGCVDYHYSDCPIRTGGSSMTMDDYLAEWGRNGYDPDFYRDDE